ncbi:MAG: DsbA family protein [Pseudomonadota bacterium]
MTADGDGAPDATARKPATSGRRDLLIILAAGAGSIAAFRGASSLLDRATDDLGFISVDDPPGFRRLSLFGATTGALDPFAGIDAPGQTAETEDVLPEVPEAAFCRALFGRARVEAGIVPIAFFSDYNCPNCELLLEDLIALEAEARGRVHIQRHEWPILGEPSEISARAAIAAGRQGAQSAFNRRLQRTSFAPSEAYLREVAQSADIDPDRLIADMASDSTTRELRTSAALVRRFAFPGTPALVVGRTIVVGTIRTATLEALVRAEESAGPPPGCR